MYLHKLKCDTKRENNELRYYGPCIVTGNYYSVIVTKDQVRAYASGALAQNAFPDLSAEDREFLISGTSPKGWKILFGEDNEE